MSEQNEHAAQSRRDRRGRRAGMAVAGLVATGVVAGLALPEERRRAPPSSNREPSGPATSIPVCRAWSPKPRVGTGGTA